MLLFDLYFGWCPINVEAQRERNSYSPASGGTWRQNLSASSQWHDLDVVIPRYISVDYRYYILGPLNKDRNDISPILSISFAIFSLPGPLRTESCTKVGNGKRIIKCLDRSEGMAYLFALSPKVYPFLFSFDDHPFEVLHERRRGLHKVPIDPARDPHLFFRGQTSRQ